MTTTRAPQHALGTNLHHSAKLRCILLLRHLTHRQTV